MSGAEAYAVISGLPGLISTCISFWKLFETAKAFETNGTAVYHQMKVQQAFFHMWLEDAGLEPGRKVTILSETTQHLAEMIIEAMDGSLKELELLVEKYNLSGSTPSNDNLNQHRTYFKFRRSRDEPGPIDSASHAETMIASKIRAKPAKLLKWAVLDGENSRSLIQDLVLHNQNLRNLLQARQRVVISELPSLILPQIHDHETLILAYDDYTEDLGVCAEFKGQLLERQRMISNAALAVPASSIMSRRTVDNTGRAVGSLRRNGTLMPVVLEDKTYDRNSKASEEFVRQRMQDLFTVLSVPNKPVRLRILNYIGFTQNRKNGNFSFIMEYPTDADPTVEPLSLLSLIKRTPKPPAKERIALAHMMASSVALLQACGILHKAIYEGNILFFKSRGRDEDSYRLADAFISGFDYARLDGKDVISEEHAISFAEKRIYTHPDYSFKSQDRYRKTYDFYSFGVLLFQIGMWKTLAEVREIVKPERIAVENAKRELQAGGYSEDKVVEALKSLELETAPKANIDLKPRQIFQKNLQQSVEMLQEEVGQAYMAAVVKCVSGDVGGDAGPGARQSTGDDERGWEEEGIHEKFIRDVVVQLGRAL